MNIKGQGALEYLLLIGGAVLVAAIVIALVTGIPTGVSNPQDAVICGENVTAAACDAETLATCSIRGSDGLDYVDSAALAAAAGSPTFLACVAT